jgi:regulation of enolase protein 1 (concanavalin A-like superfamily)
VKWQLRGEEGKTSGGIILTMGGFLLLLMFGISIAQTPESWTSKGVGQVGKPGSAHYDELTDTFQVSAGGSGILLNTEKEDSFHFLYRPLAGDGQLTARVVSTEPVPPGNGMIGGISIRGGIGSGSAGGFIGISPTNGVYSGYRERSSSHPAIGTIVSPSTKAPLWLKLVRRGTQVYQYYSMDGMAWTLLTSARSVPSTGTVYAGLAATSLNTNLVGKVIFDHVNLQSGFPVDQTAPTTPTGLMVQKRTDASISLRWNPSSDDVGALGYRIYRGDKFLDSASSSFFTDTLVSPGTTYTYRIQAFDGSGKRSGMSQIVTVTTLPESLPQPFKHQDFGIVGEAGTALINGTTAKVRGTGLGIGSSGDHFHFLYRAQQGNFEIKARLSAISGGIPDSPVGLMIRETLHDSSLHGSILISENRRLRFLSRPWFRTNVREQGTTSTSFLWMKLSRVGNVITAHISHDNVQWKLVGSEVLAMGHTVLAGIAVASLENLHPVEATFSGLEYTILPDSQFITPPPPLPSQTAEPVATINVVNTRARTGDWLARDDGLLAVSNTGTLEYLFNVPEDGMYRVEVVGRAFGSIGQIILPLDLELDGQFLDRVHLFSNGGSSDGATAFTPWIRKGSHRLRILWNNGYSANHLILRALRVTRLPGEDSNGNGRPDWVDARIQEFNSMDPIPASSPTSPICVEGKSRFQTLTRVNGGGVRRGPGERWFANIGLSPTNSTRIRSIFENGAKTNQTFVVWKETNLLTETNKTIRLGDSLLFNARPGTNSTGNVQIEIVGKTNLLTTAKTPVPYKFTNPGTFTVFGKYGSSTSRSIQVKVVKSTFPSESPRAWVGRKRVWDVPGIAREAMIEADPRIRFDLVKNLTGGGRRFSILLDQAFPRVVASRLGPKGPILSTAVIEGVELFSSTQTSVQVIGRLPDGTLVVDMVIQAAGDMTGMEIVLEIFASGTTFDDGSLTKRFTAADFAEDGSVRVRFYRSSGGAFSVCHRMKVFHGGVLLGTR